MTGSLWQVPRALHPDSPDLRLRAVGSRRLAVGPVYLQGHNSQVIWAKVQEIARAPPSFAALFDTRLAAISGTK